MRTAGGLQQSFDPKEPHELSLKPSGTTPVNRTSGVRPTIRRLTGRDRTEALNVINTAAAWYQEFLDHDTVHSPEMDEGAWDAEARRMTWWGAFADGQLIGVMGCEPAGDAVLMRHAYVLPEYQRKGVGTALLVHSEQTLPVPVRIVIGTYAANYKARGNLEKAGYLPSSNSENLLRKYYDIPEERIRTSIAYEKVLRPCTYESPVSRSVAG